MSTIIVLNTWEVFGSAQKRLRLNPNYVNGFVEQDVEWGSVFLFGRFQIRSIGNLPTNSPGLSLELDLADAFFDPQIAASQLSAAHLSSYGGGLGHSNGSRLAGAQ